MTDVTSLTMPSLPTWEEFMVPALNALADGQVRPVREVRESASASLGLTEEQRAVRIPSGQLMYTNRAGWALSYLHRAGGVERPSRGQYRLTPTGHTLLATHPHGLTEADLRELPGYVPRHWKAADAPPVPGPAGPGGDIVGGGSRPPSGSEVPVMAERLAPTEQIDLGVARLHESVAADLLERLHDQDPAFFEQAVLDLLLAMGYGGSRGTATRTSLTHDGGIDGVIDQDALGLSRIYVQAKCDALDGVVQRPAIQAFAGALQGAQADQGVFLTTATFSAGAREYAERLPTRIVLVDGARLAALMIRYEVGVQVRRMVKVVEIDEDFFE